MRFVFSLLVTCGSLTIYPKSVNATLQDQIYPPSSSPYGLSHKNWGIALWDWWMYASKLPRFPILQGIIIIALLEWDILW